MFAALWFNLKAEPGSRITVCEPFLKTENAAWLVLRSDKREDKPGLVLDGEAKLLSKLIEVIQDQDKTWSDNTVESLIQKIETLAQKDQIRVILKQNVIEASIQPGDIYQFNDLDAVETSDRWEVLNIKDGNVSTNVYKTLKGETAGPRNSWNYSIKAFKRMIKTYPLIKVVSELLDDVANTLDQREANALAEEVDAMRIIMLRHVQRDRLQQDLDSLISELINGCDFEREAQIILQLNELEKELDSKDYSGLSKDNNFSHPTGLTQ